MTEYVTETGFTKKTFEELKAYYETVLKSIFGKDIDLDPEQAAGQLLDDLASTEAQLWDIAQDIYTSNDLNKAVGVALDNNVGSLLGILRQDATKAKVQNVVLYGSEGTVVTTGKRARNSTNVDSERVYFELDANATITQTACRDARLSIDFDVTNTYTLTIDGTAYNVGVQANAGDVADAMVVELLAGGFNAEKVFDADNNPLIRVFYGDGVEGASATFDLQGTSNLVVEEFGSPGNFTALREGFVSVGEGFISEIATGQSGWARVYNIDPKVVGTGTGVELDPEYRARLAIGASATGFATENAIRKWVLNQIPSVSACVVASNRTLTPFAAGAPTNSQPGKSFQTYVDGVGPLSGAPTEDQQVLAEAIFEAAPAGIEIFGTEGPIEVEDDDGQLQPVYYSTIQGISIDVHVGRVLYEEFNDYPADGDDLIKDALITYARDNWGLGKDVIPSRLIVPIYNNVSGIGSMVISARINGSGDPFSTDTIPIGSASVATLDIANITLGGV
jgi:hypothetical protein